MLYVQCEACQSRKSADHIATTRWRLQSSYVVISPNSNYCCFQLMIANNLCSLIIDYALLHMESLIFRTATILFSVIAI